MDKQRSDGSSEVIIPAFTAIHKLAPWKPSPETKAVFDKVDEIIKALQTQQQHQYHPHPSQADAKQGGDHKDSSSAAESRQDKGSLRAEDESDVGVADSSRYIPLLCKLCQMKGYPKIVVIALECIQKFIKFNYIQGSTLVADIYHDEKDKITITNILIRTLNESGNVIDDDIQLRVIEILHSLVVLPSFGLHDQGLLLSFRTCYSIHLYSKNAINKATAKQALVRMVEHVFRALDNEGSILNIRISSLGAPPKIAKIENEKQEQPNEPPSSSSTSAAAATVPITIRDENNQVKEEDEDKAGQEQEQIESAPKEENADNVSTSGSNNQDVHEEEDKQEISQESDNVDSAAEARKISTTPDQSSVGISAEEEDDDRIFREAKEQVNNLAPTAAASTHAHGDKAENAASSSSATASSVNQSSQAPKISQMKTPRDINPIETKSHGLGRAHKDAIILFKALCRLSMKAESFGRTHSSTVDDGADPIALKTKVLSLDLIKSALDAGGRTLRTSPHLINAIKEYLVSSLIKNCVSANTQVVGLSLRIFIILQADFKDHLKEEIEVFIAKIFLRILESPNSVHEHKVLVLEVFVRICKDVQTLVELFINYDCDFDSMDLFYRIVQVLAKIASKRDPDHLLQTASQSVRNTITQNNALHLMALDSLTSILRSLSEYTYSEEMVGTLHLKSSSPRPSSKLQDTDNESEIVVIDKERSRASSKEGDDKDTASVSDAQTVASAMPAATTAVDSFQAKQKRRKDMQICAAKFNVKPSDGLSYALKNHLIDDMEPNTIASFLYENRDLLSKTQIGDYLGGDKQINLQVLYQYVDIFNFIGQTIDEALRVFLACFRLPGEAQKIDRMMEKFASRYCGHNPNIFPNADTAYVLAYAIIMLQTDAHNPNIKPEKKMKKEEFIKNNRGIASGHDLDSEFLGGIYDRIVKTAISLKEDDSARESSGQNAATAGIRLSTFGDYQGRSKKEAYSKERVDILTDAEASLKSGRDGKKNKKATTNIDYVSQSNMANANDGSSEIVQFVIMDDANSLFKVTEHVKPMFEVVWAPMCAVFSVNLQVTDDPQVCSICLQGMKSAIRVAGRFSMANERDTLVDAIAKFTLLDASVRDLKVKNIDCIQTLISIASTEGDYLQNSWAKILLCVSNLHRLQLLKCGGDTLLSAEGDNDTAHFTSKTAKQTNVSNATSWTQLASYFSGVAPGGIDPAVLEEQKKSRAIEEENFAKIRSRIDLNLVDTIFLRSVNLSSSAIVDFVSSLCEVSRVELLMSSEKLSELRAVAAPEGAKPRIFALQKLVEIADYNMLVRPRYLWSRIWNILSDHFASAGKHALVTVGMFAVDALRQLSNKFLSIDEIEGFNFQLQFLHPFEDIIRNSKSKEIRALVISCIEFLVASKADKIKSGWQTIIRVIGVAGADQHIDNAEMGMKLFKSMEKNHNSKLIDRFTDSINLIMSFASNRKLIGSSDGSVYKRKGNGDEIALNVLKMLEDGLVLLDQRTAKSLTVGDNINLARSSSDPSSLLTDIDREYFTLLLLCGMIFAFSDERKEIRRAAMKTFFNELKQRKYFLSSHMWERIWLELVLPTLLELKNLSDNFIPLIPGPEIKSFSDSIQNKDLIRPLNVPYALLMDAKEDWHDSTLIFLLNEISSIFTELYCNSDGKPEAEREVSTSIDDGEEVDQNEKNSKDQKQKDSAAIESKPLSPEEALKWVENMQKFIKTTAISSILRIFELLSTKDLDNYGKIGVHYLTGLLALVGDKGFVGDIGSQVVASLERVCSNSFPSELVSKNTRDIFRLTPQNKVDIWSWQTLSNLDKDKNSSFQPPSSKKMANRKSMIDEVSKSSVGGAPTEIDSVLADEDEDDNNNGDDENQMEIKNSKNSQHGDVIEPSSIAREESTASHQPSSVSAVSTTIPNESTVDNQTSLAATQNNIIASASTASENGLTITTTKKEKKSSRKGQRLTEEERIIPFNIDRVMRMCSLQLLLLRSVGEIVESNLAALNDDLLNRIYVIFESGVRNARLFNSDMDLRIALRDRGFMGGNANPSTPPPNLLRQESISLTALTKLLFSIADATTPLPLITEKGRSAAELKLAHYTRAVVHQYVKYDRYIHQQSQQSQQQQQQNQETIDQSSIIVIQEVDREQRSLQGILLSILRRILVLESSEFEKLLKWVYPLLSCLIECNNREVRMIVKSIMDKFLPKRMGISSFDDFDLFANV